MLSGGGLCVTNSVKIKETGYVGIYKTSVIIFLPRLLARGCFPHFSQ